MKTHQHNIIKEIAQELDCGNDCYFNLKTKKIIAIPNLSQVFDEEEFKEAFGLDIEMIEKHSEDYIKIDNLKSHISFKIMEQFIEQLPKQKLKVKLESILENKNPFQNFKHEIDRSEYRQDWFGFKQSELEKIVENQINKFMQP